MGNSARSCCSCEDETGHIDHLEGKSAKDNRRRVPGEFVVTVDRRSGDGLGIDASPEKDGTLEIRTVQPGGLVDKWNRSHEGEPNVVRAGMRVVEVNGRFNSALHLIAACREMDVLQLTVTPAGADDDNSMRRHQ
uniref:PDZ domain-containing protein n=1 Tax=Noctiluca scintillans TaxID=2966 RepID=A0A7S1F1C1_NOCSC